MPLLFEEKQKWAVPEPEEWECPRIMDNYRSAADHPEEIKRQFEKDVARGWMLRLPMSEAKRR